MRRSRPRPVRPPTSRTSRTCRAARRSWSARDPMSEVTMGLRYACITPARDEAHNLPRLARSLMAQTVPPERWVIVDNGSTDGTADVVRALAGEFPAIELLEVPGDATAVRGAPIVR